MPKVILICGMICSGKTTYANKVARRQKAVLLSCDELSLSLFDNNLGEHHDEVISKIKQYLLKKAVELNTTLTNVVLDWGFWSRDEREETRQFFNKNGITTQLHYIDISKSALKKNIEIRNEEVNKGNSNNYYIDDNLFAKASSSFEVPTSDEIDVLFKDNRG